MNLTMIIAIIGCVTGVISLLIEAAGFFSERSRVKMGTFDELNNFIYLNGDVINCFLNLRVMNTGGKYIIVQDVYMRRPGYDKKTASGIRPPHRGNIATGILWKLRLKSIFRPAYLPAVSLRQFSPLQTSMTIAIKLMKILFILRCAWSWLTEQ